MANDKQNNEVEPKATPIAPGEPVEDIAITQMGATFAERQAAREKAEKSLSGDSDSVEDKAVKRTSRKSKKG